MKKYIGKKTINAMPMKRGEYNNFRGWTLPDDENGEDEGYLVEYIDGGKANTPEYDGYVSWSPKEVFDKAYKCAESYKDRLDIEIKELEDKMEKLENFISSKQITEIPKDKAAALMIQYNAMQTYLNILEFRRVLEEQ